MLPRPLQWLWPDINDYQSSRSAVNRAYYAATVLSVVFFFTAFLSIYATATGVDHRWDFLDAAVFMLVGWFLKDGGRKSCIAGLVFCAFEFFARFVQPLQAAGLSVPLALWGLVMCIALLMFVGGVRGATGLLRYPAPPPVATPAEPAGPKKKPGGITGRVRQWCEKAITARPRQR